MERQFGRGSKTAFHSYNNMAKAALNMMTRTSAAGYARSGICLNSVDITAQGHDSLADALMERLQRNRDLAGPANLSRDVALTRSVYRTV